RQKPQAAGRSREQLAADSRCEPFQRDTRDGRRHVELTRGRRQTAVIGRADKYHEVFESDHLIFRLGRYASKPALRRHRYCAVPLQTTRTRVATIPERAPRSHRFVGDNESAFSTMKAFPSGRKPDMIKLLSSSMRCLTSP